MDKGKLHHRLTMLKHIKMWQLVLLLLIFIGAATLSLRQNNLQMISLRNAVTAADENPTGDTKKALTNLQNYVSAHMNTDLGTGLYLQQTYQRAYTASLDAAANQTNPQAAIYAQVEAQCQPVFKQTHSFPAYTQCAHDKLSQLAPGQDQVANFKGPDADLYHYNFASPVISFDWAGMFVILTGVVGVVVIARALAYMTLKLLLKRKHTRI